MVRAGRRFLVTGHANPDGDALGSMLATRTGCARSAKRWSSTTTIRRRGGWRFCRAPTCVTDAAKLDGPFDATFVHDCGDAHLLGDRFPARDVTGPLDRRRSSRQRPQFGDLALRDSSAAAVGVIVARLLDALGVPLDKTIAECLWCSLASDTGWFRYSSTDVGDDASWPPRASRRARVPWEFARRSEEERPPARLRLMARVLGTLELVGASALLDALTQADDGTRRQRREPPTAEGFVNYARGLEGVEVGVMLFEADGGVRVSLRSKGAVDVGAVAARFGGGGHRAAAGCFVAGTADARQATLLRAPSRRGSA